MMLKLLYNKIVSTTELYAILNVNEETNNYFIYKTNIIIYITFISNKTNKHCYQNNMKKFFESKYLKGLEAITFLKRNGN